MNTFSCTAKGLHGSLYVTVYMGTAGGFDNIIPDSFIHGGVYLFKYIQI